MPQRISVAARFALFLLISLMLSLAPVIRAQSAPGKAQGKTRTYYIAADEVNWNYAPSGRDEAMGMPFDEISKLYTEPGPHRIGSVYKKAVYREYTDASFSTESPAARRTVSRPAGPHFARRSWRYHQSGLQEQCLASLQHASARSSIKKTPRARITTTPPAAPTRATAECLPGATHIYIWEVSERSGPGPNDPSRFSGSITRTRTNCATSPRGCSAGSWSRGAGWRSPTAVRRMWITSS